MPYIETINHEQSEGRLKEIYDGLVKSRGKLAEVHMIQSLNPESIVHHMDLYMGIMFGRSPLKRKQREMIAVVVSAANQCEYCIVHHGAALEHFWKDADRVKNFAVDYTSVGLNATDLALCAYAQKLSLEPHLVSQADVDRIKAEGLEDRAVLDAALVISYFNFVNRMVLGCGVQLEADRGSGYHYD